MKKYERITDQNDENYGHIRALIGLKIPRRRLRTSSSLVTRTIHQENQHKGRRFLLKTCVSYTAQQLKCIPYERAA